MNIRLTDLKINSRYSLGDLNLKAISFKGNLEKITITPRAEEQRIYPSAGKDGIGEVIVEGYPEGLIKPEGEVEITENGSHDVREFAIANVDVKPKLQEKTATSNGPVTADEGYDGLSKVDVDCSDMLQTMVDMNGHADYLFANYNGTSFEPFKGLDISKATFAKNMFFNAGSGMTYNNDFDTSKITNMSYMFNDAKFTEVSLNTDSATNLSNIFYASSSSTPLKKVYLSNTSKATDMSKLFSMRASLSEISSIDTSNATKTDSMFESCWALKNFPEIDLSSATSATSMFRDCRALTSVVVKNAGLLTNISSMFSSCTSLVEMDFSGWGLASLSQVNSLFSNCTNLETVKGLDLYPTRYMSSIFSGCKNLKNLEINNITGSGSNFQIGSGTSYGTLVTDESLVYIANQLFDREDAGIGRKFIVSTASNERLDAIYVKSVSITSEMAEKDPYISEKKPIVACESTDSGAMTLREYIVSKYWTISTS